MRRTLILLALALLLGQCKLEVEDACIRHELVELENFACISGQLEFCRCPSTDVNVQAQCDDFNLPDRSAPEPVCE